MLCINCLLNKIQSIASIRELGLTAGLDTYFKKAFRDAESDVQEFRGERPEFFDMVKKGGVPKGVARNKMSSSCKVRSYLSHCVLRPSFSSFPCKVRSLADFLHIILC